MAIDDRSKDSRAWSHRSNTMGVRLRSASRDDEAVGGDGEGSCRGAGRGSWTFLDILGSRLAPTAQTWSDDR